MTEFRLPESLWRNCLVQEGCIERWRVPEGTQVMLGQLIVDVMVEGACVPVAAPASGILTQTAPVGWVVDPGFLIGEIQPAVI